MIPSNKIIVALDTCEESKLQKLFYDLRDENIWVKIGMELFYSLGTKSIYQAKEMGLNVFLDLKLHDIPNTVSQALRSLSKLPIDMVNLHAAGGKEMMMKGMDTLLGMPKRPLLIAVTQLTSTTQEQMNIEQGIPGKIQNSVLQYAKLAHESQLDGVVCSPLEVKMIKESLGIEFLTITPGIRPAGNELNDQKRVTTPIEAMNLGTDFMVIGRPITASDTPKLALANILKGV
jgi:orotidine-5'-phosphate decarboxylase